MERCEVTFSHEPDVYFMPEYAKLYVKQGESIERFVHSNGENIFSILMHVRPLNAGGIAAYDFETPYGYAGPIASTDDVQFLTEAWEAFRDFARAKKIFAGFIRFHPYLKNHRLAGPARFVETSLLRQTVTLALDLSPAEAWNGYRRDTRDRVKKAQKIIRVRRDADAGSLRIFAAHYRRRMQDVSAAEFYFFDETYFDRLQVSLAGKFQVYLAFEGERSVGGALILEGQRYIHLHLSAVDEASQSSGAAHLIRHTIIQDYLGKKENIHFGGGNSNLPDDSLLRFKGGFSPARSDFWIGKALMDPELYGSVCSEWETRCPEKIEAAAGRFLKYRN
jgi:hypothetical protein